jgi:ABC-2 type transport system ATP-binding protein
MAARCGKQQRGKGDEKMNALAAEIVELRAGYGKDLVLKGVTLDIAYGEWFALLGPNGSGKTTLLNCMSDRHEPRSGRIELAGFPLSTGAQAAKARLGAVCAPEELPKLLTGRQCLDVYAGAKRLADWGDEVVELAEALRFTPYLDAFVDTYSLGTRQKLCILLGLMGDPRVILLDESFNGLDPASALIVKRRLRKRLEARDCALILATHSLDIVERYADRAALLLEGRIARQWKREEIAAARETGGLELQLADLAA